MSLRLVFLQRGSLCVSNESSRRDRKGSEAYSLGSSGAAFECQKFLAIEAETADVFLAVSLAACLGTISSSDSLASALSLQSWIPNYAH